MTARTSALLVTYVWPPTGGVGSLRVRKLAKYLPEHGVTPTVLTAANPSVPLIDESLMEDVPPNIEVIRARTFEPGYATKQNVWSQSRSGQQSIGLKQRAKRGLAAVARQALIPDPQLLWQPAVQRTLFQRLRAKRDDIVFITAPPFSTFLSAPLVRAVGNAALVLDYRDEWLTARTQYEMLSRVGGAVGGIMEHGVLKCADAVTVATEGFREQLLERFTFLDPARVVAIPNGYDAADTPADFLETHVPPRDRFVITYAGSNIFKQNSPRGLMQALRLLKEREPELARALTVRFVGRIVETELDVFAGSEELGVECVGFIDKAKVAPLLAASHMTLCILDVMPGVERIYPAKTFELMALGRPVLTLAPPGALTDLVATHRLGPVIAPRDAPAIADALASALRAWKAGTYDVRSHPLDIEKFDRRVIAGQFADLFHSLRARR
jgi:glycosyltransferase involved in cell wall biosynthesis